MERPYLVKASLDILFEEVTDIRKKEFNWEFSNLTELEVDPIGHWLKMKKAKGETQDSDEVLIELVVDLHRKVDKLEKLIQGKVEKLLDLKNSAIIDMVGFHHFQIADQKLDIGKMYYGRIDFKVYPERDIPVFFKAIDENLVEIKKIHIKDETDWGTFFRARERVMIREQRSNLALK
jgi:hypothetical protein